MTDSLCFLHIHIKSCFWPAFSYRQEDSLGWPNTWLLHLAYLLCSLLQCCHGHWGAQFHWILLETFSYRPTKLVPLWKPSPWVLWGWQFSELISGKVSCSSQSDLVVICGQAFSLCSCFNITNPSSPIFVPSASLCSVWVSVSFLRPKHFPLGIFILIQTSPKLEQVAHRMGSVFFSTQKQMLTSVEIILCLVQQEQFLLKSL